MVLPLDDILKAISRGGGPGAQIARGAMRPTQIGGTDRFLSPTFGGGPLAHLAGSLAAPKPPEREEGPGGIFGTVLKGLDLGRGLIVSSIKEGIDMAQDVAAGRLGDGEWSPSEWWKQATSHYGFGDLIHDEREWVGGGLIALSPFTAGVSGLLGAGVLAENIWADRIVGFVGDVALDPLMYMGGFGAFARGLGWQKVARSLGDFAAHSTDDLVRLGVAKSAKSAKQMKTLADNAAAAAEKSQSLTGASKYLLKHTDPLAREVAEQLGLSAGLRLRMPGTHALGRFMRQDRYIDWAMKQLPKKVGLAEGVAGQQLKNVPGYYRSVLPEDLLQKGIKAYRTAPTIRLGGAARREAVEEVRGLAIKTLGDVDSEMLMRVAGQAARSPLEVALPGFVKGGARVGLGANLITKVTDLPMRTALRLTPEKVQEKLAVHFQPNEMLRALRKSGNPRHLQIALGADDFMRHARGIEHFVERTIAHETDNIIKRSAGYKVSDEAMTDLADALERVAVLDAEGEVVRLAAGEVGSAQRMWWDNMVPDEIKQLDPEAQRILARDVKRWQSVTKSHLDDTWPGLTDGMAAKTQQAYGAPQRIRDDNLPHMFNRQDYSQIDEFAPSPGGTKKPWLFDAHGRITPASMQSRTWLPGSKIIVENPDASASVARGVVRNRVGKNRLTGKDIVADVLADPQTGVVFTVKPPDEVGMSIRKQINLAHEKSFGRPMYENDFSVLLDKWKTGMARDIKMERFMQRLATIYPAFKPDDLIEPVGRALDDYAVATEAAGTFTRKQRGLKGRADNARSAAATHVATQERQSEKVAQLSLQARQADEEIAVLDRLLLDLQAEARGMEDELAEFGLTLENLKPTAERVLKFEGKFGPRAKQKILEAEGLAARKAQIEESMVAAKKVRDAHEALVRQETDQWVRNVAGDIEGLQAATAAYRQSRAATEAAQADYDDLVGRVAHLDKRFNSVQVDLEGHTARVERLVAEAERLEGLERLGELRRAEVRGRPEVVAAQREVDIAAGALKKEKARLGPIEAAYEEAQKAERALLKSARRWAKSVDEAREVLEGLESTQVLAVDAQDTAKANLATLMNNLEQRAPMSEADRAAETAYTKAVKAAGAKRTAEQLAERPQGAHHRTWTRLRSEEMGAEAFLKNAAKRLKEYNESVAKRQINKTRERAYAVRRESLRNQIKAKREEIAEQEARGPFKTQGPETARRNKIRRAEYELVELQRELDEAYKVGVGGQREKWEEAVRIQQSRLDRVRDEMQALRDAAPQRGPERTLKVPGHPRGRPEATYMQAEAEDIARLRAAVKKADEAYAATQTKRILEKKRRAQELVDAGEELKRLVTHPEQRVDQMGRVYTQPASGALIEARRDLARARSLRGEADKKLEGALGWSEKRGRTIKMSDLAATSPTHPRLSSSGTLYAVSDDGTEGLIEFGLAPRGRWGEAPEDMSAWAAKPRRRPGVRPTKDGGDPLYPDLVEDTAQAETWRLLRYNEGLAPDEVPQKILVKAERKDNKWSLVDPAADVDTPIEAGYGTVGRAERTLAPHHWRFYDEGRSLEERLVADPAKGVLDPDDPVLVEAMAAVRLHDEAEAELKALRQEIVAVKGEMQRMEMDLPMEEHGPVHIDHYGRETGTRGKEYRAKRPLIQDEADEELLQSLVDTDAHLRDLEWQEPLMVQEAKAARLLQEPLMAEAKRLAGMTAKERTRAARVVADAAERRLAIRERMQTIRSGRLAAAEGELEGAEGLFAGGAQRLPRQRPEDVPGLYSSEDELSEAFAEGVENLTEQLDYLALQLKIITASGTGLAEQDRTVQAMRVLLRNMRSGVGGTRSLTPDGRMNTWINRLKDFEELDAALQHEAFAAGARLEKVPNSRTGIKAFNEAYQRETVGLEGLRTQLVEAGGASVAGRRLKGGKWVPFKLSADDLAEKQARLDFAAAQKAEYDGFVAKRAQLDADIEKAKRLGGEARQQELKRQKDVLELETRHAGRQLNEWAELAEAEGATYEAARTVEQRLMGVVESMEQRAQRVGSTLEGYSPKEAGGRTFRQTVLGTIERGGNVVDEGTGKTLFDLKAKDRAAAQELLKDAFGSSEWGPWRLLSGDEALDGQMLDVINAFAKINDPSEFGWDGTFWRGWDKVQTYLKAAMIATPGFVNRNIFGAFFNAWLDGVNLTEIIKSMSMTHEVAKYARGNQVSVLRAAKALAKDDPNRWKHYVELLEVGVRGGGQAINAVELQIGLRNARNLEFMVGQRDKAGRLVPGGKQYSVSWKPWSARFAPYQSVRSVNSWVEDTIRLGIGMDTMRWGGSVDDALNRIAKSQFDYDELTQFERQVMKRFFPFYTWTRKNVPYQLKQLGAHPYKYNRLLSAKRNLELGTEEEGVVPDYYMEPFGVRMPFGFRGATVYSTPDIPFQDLFRYDPFREGMAGYKGPKKAALNLASMATPILKAPLEVAFGKQVFNGIPFTGRYGVAPNSIKEIPGLSHSLEGIGWIKRAPDGTPKMRDHHIYFVTSLLPTLGLLRRLWPNEPKYQRNYVRSLVSTLGGMSANFNTPEVQHNWLQSQRFDRADLRRDHMDLISKRR